ncbi:MAG: response regulator [Bdellovibrionota bacterium]
MAAGDSILVVDDEEQIQSLLQTILKLKKYEVTPARTGGEALEILAKKNDIKLILLDLRLPDCDGIELTKRIKNEIPKRIPIILISGNPDLQYMELPEEVVGTIGKPFHFVELLGLIESSCANQI